MASQVATVGTTVVSFLEEVADALDNSVGLVVELGTTANESSVKVASVGDNDNAIGVVVGKLQQTTGKKEAVSVALIDCGGIARVKAGGAINKGAGVAVSGAVAGEVVTAARASADSIGIALEAAADGDLFNVILSRSPNEA